MGDGTSYTTPGTVLTSQLQSSRRFALTFSISLEKASRRLSVASNDNYGRRLDETTGAGSFLQIGDYEEPPNDGTSGTPCKDNSDCSGYLFCSKVCYNGQGCPKFHDTSWDVSSLNYAVGY